MKLKRTVLGPGLVTLVAIVSGGWLLQHQGGSKGPLGSPQLFNEVLQRISNDYVEQYPDSKLYQMAIEGMIQELGDPHTTFMTAEQYNALRIQTTGEYGGLGIQIDQRDGWVTVVAPLPGTPAERAGIQAGDRIVEVDGKSTQGWTSDDAVKVLRGPVGAPVTIRVARIGVDQTIPYTIRREEIHVQSVNSSYTAAPGIGYAKLTVFSETSTDELRDAINRLRAQGDRALILDLRMNPGGLLDQGVSVSDLFLGRGQAVVETRSRDPRDTRTYRATSAPPYPDLRMVVLVDEFSASAAEIVAGALQDHDRALVVGTTSYGKGSVQTLIPLSGGNFLKLTTGKWYTPSGRSIQKERQLANGTVVMDNEPVSPEDSVSLLPAAPTDTTKRKPYRTDSGRIVYGGGGIVPDLIVKPDTLTQGEKAFVNAVVQSGGNKFNDVLFRYSIDYAKANPSLRPDFPVTPAMRQELYNRLRAAGVAVTPEQYQGAERMIDARLGYEIVLHKFGQAAAVQRGNMDDPVMRTAVQLLQSTQTQKALFEAARARAGAAGAGAR